MLAREEWLRCSALGHGERVKVAFFNQRREERCYWMSHATYDAIPLLDPATPEDFARHGTVTLARSNDIYDADL